MTPSVVFPLSHSNTDQLRSYEKISASYNKFRAAQDRYLDRDMDTSPFVGLHIDKSTVTMPLKKSPNELEKALVLSLEVTQGAALFNTNSSVSKNE